MYNFSDIVVVVGRVKNNEVLMLGTAFAVAPKSLFVTPLHVIGANSNNLVILVPKIQNINEYQDTSDLSCTALEVDIIEADPCKDIAILKLKNAEFCSSVPQIGSFDGIVPGEEIEIYGYPHCVTGRNVLTVQKAEIGSKVLLNSQGIKSKYAVINTQSRPGQSGSLIYSRRLNQIVGMLIGTYVPPGAGVVVGGVNPHELNQTTQCISAHYIKEML